MPELKNKRQEKFCQLVASGVTQTEAVRQCGYLSSTPSDSAYKIMKLPYIVERIAQIADERAVGVLQRTDRPNDVATTARRTRAEDVDARWVLQSMVNLYEDAALARDRGSQLRSLQEVGKLLGLYVERSEVTTTATLDTASAATMTAMLRLVEGIEAGRLVPRLKPPTIEVTATVTSDE